MILTKKGKLSAKYEKGVRHLVEINKKCIGSTQELVKVICIKDNCDSKGKEYELLHLYACMQDLRAKDDLKYFVFNERWGENDFGTWFTAKEFDEFFKVVEK
jgi:hypothetical protein